MEGIPGHIKGYRILNGLEQGNYSNVYRATDPAGDRLILKCARSNRPQCNDLIAREFQVLSRIKHPAIVPVRDFDVDPISGAFFTMNEIPGTALHRYFRGYSPELADALLRVLEGLAAFHGQGLVHGDLKPDHILYDPSSRSAVIIDFGFAGISKQWATVGGTIGYIAPEIIKGMDPDQRSDLFSVGVILYETVAGHRPAPAFEDLPSLPAPLNRLLRRMLSSEPALRPALPEIRQALERLIPRRKVRTTEYRVDLPTTVFIPPAGIDLGISAGSCRFISGEPGSGKTRLLMEIQYRHQLDGRRVLRCHGGEKTSCIQAIASFCGAALDRGAEEKSRFAAYETVCQKLRELSQDHGVTVLIDDAEQLGENDQAFLRYLGFAVADTRIAVVASGRTGSCPVPDGWIISTVPAWTAETVRELLDQTFAPLEIRGNADAIAWLWKRSSGLPLYLVELLRNLHRADVLAYADGRWTICADELERIKIPLRIEDMLEGKYLRLPPQHRVLLDCVCLLDAAIESDVLQDMLATPVWNGLEYLKYHGFLREGHEGTRRTVMIGNDAMIPIAQRGSQPAAWKDLRARAVTALSARLADRPYYHELVARLMRELGDHEPAAEHFQAAGRHSESGYDYPTALAHYRVAADIIRRSHPVRSAELLMDIGRLSRFLGRRDETCAAYQRVIDEGPPPLAARAHMELGAFLSTLLEYETGTKHLELARSQLPGDHEDHYRAGNTLAYLWMFCGRGDEAARLLEESLAWAKPRPQPRLTAETLYLRAVREWSCDEFALAQAGAREAYEFSAAAGLDKEQADAALLIAICAMSRYDHKTAQDYLDRALAGYRRLNRMESIRPVLINQAIISFCGGAPAEAERILLDTLRQSRQTGDREGQYVALKNLGEIHEMSGRFDEAYRTFEDAHNIIPGYLDPVVHMANILLKKDQLETARSLLEAHRPQATDSEYELAWMNLKTDLGDNAGAALHLREADRQLADKPRPVRRLNYLMTAAHFYYEAGDHARALKEARHALAAAKGHAYYTPKMNSLVKLSATWLGKEPDPDLAHELRALETMGALYDYAWFQILRLECQTARGRETGDPAGVQAVLDRCAEIFKSLDAERESRRLTRLRERISPGLTRLPADKSPTRPYVDAFERLAELISHGLGEEAFFSQVLDLIISVTAAERGALFVKIAAGMTMAAGRDLDQTTVRDAEHLSQSAIAASNRNRIVYIPDALHNPDYNITKSVMLNQIHSLVCMPLAVGNDVIGALYLDSRTPEHRLGSADKDFLLAVSRILAAVIEQSIAFSDTRRENALLKSNIIREIGSGYLIGRSRAMKKVYRTIDDTAPTNVPVLILGETGTGKGMIARLIHQKSSRHSARFLSINCGTIPETLLESELFGHKKGSFTGATSDKRGLLEEAVQGTVFLDELANTTLSFQAKLLEAIEDKVIRRIGETAVRNIDVRFLFATNRDLEIEVEEGRFRKDLYYRINVFQIELPPLRERQTDIPRLAQLFLERFSREINKPLEGISVEALHWLQNYYWPGNVRELQNFMERAVIQTKGRRIMIRDFGVTAGSDDDPDRLMNDRKKEAIIAALHKTGGHVTKAAELLGINRRTIQRYIKDHHLKK